MGLFTQDVKVGLVDGKNVIEKFTIQNVKKGKINLYVKPGSICIMPTLGNHEFLGQNAPYQLSRDYFVQQKGDSCDVYTYSDKGIALSVPFFGGQYRLKIPGAKGLRGTYALVGNAYLQVTDYGKLAMHYGRSVTEEEIVEDLKKNYRKAISEEITTTANRFITEDTDETKLNALGDEILASMIEDGGKAAAVLRVLGLRISSKKMTMHLNALEDVEEITKKISDKEIETTIFDMDANVRKDEADKLAASRQFEIDQIKAQNTNVEERKQDTNINQTINGEGRLVTDHAGHSGRDVSFCPGCGTRIEMNDVHFCPKCGRKLR